MRIEKCYPSRLNHVRDACLKASEIARNVYNSVLDSALPLFIQEVELIVGEACTNTINHSDLSGQGKFIIQYQAKAMAYKILVMDQNPEFDFYHVPKPEFSDIPENGYGLYIIKKLTDEVIYKRKNGWNILTMIKYIVHK